VAEPLRRTVGVRCDVAHAYDVFTERIDLWWPRGHRRHADSRLVLEATLGGRFYEVSPGGGELPLGTVIACEPPNSISFTWQPGAIKGPTRVDVTFVQEGDDTLVHVLHSEGDSALGEAWPGRVAIFSRNWDQVLSVFVAYADASAVK